MNEDYYIDQLFEDRFDCDYDDADYYDEYSSRYCGDDETCPICDSDDLTIDGDRVDCNSCGFCFDVSDL